MPATLSAVRSMRDAGSTYSPTPSLHRSSDATAATADLVALEQVLHTLLSPLDYPDFRSWLAAAHEALLDFGGTDALCIFTPMAEGPASWYGPHVGPAEMAGYLARLAEDPDWDVIDRGYERCGRPVAHESELMPREALEASAFYHEFLRPNRILDLTVAGADFGGRRQARLHFSNTSRRSRDAAQRCASRARTVLPALRAGLATWRQLGERRAELGRMLDAMPTAVLLYDTTGALQHANRTAQRLFDGPSAERVRAEAQRVAWALGATIGRSAAVSPERDVRTAGGDFRLRGSLAPEWMLGASRGVLVTVERAERQPLSDAELRERHRLTPREIEVARLVAQGLSNEEVAERLRVSFFTARNHVERLLAKLGAGSRSRVGALLRGEADAA